MTGTSTTQFPNTARFSAASGGWIVAGVSLINLFVVGVLAFSLYQSYAEYEDHAAVTAQNFSRLLAEGIGGDIDKIDLALLGAADEIERQLAGGGIDRQALNAFLARQQRRLPEIFSLRATDAMGIVSHGQGVDPAARQNNSDREYFVRQRDNPHAGLVIAKPVFTRIDKKWAVPISRSIHLPDGSFGGVVYVNLGLDYLTKTFSMIDVGRRGSISVRDAQMNVFAVHPLPPDLDKVIGEKLAVPELQALIQAGRDSGTYVTRDTQDAVERSFTVRKVPNYPLYVVVGRVSAEYMARWKDQTLRTALLALLFCLATLISSWLIYRDIGARKQAEAAVRQLNAELEQRVAQRTAQLEAMNKELEEFSYSMSHDMKTPLRALDGFSTILLEEHGAGLDTEGKRLLKVLRDNARRMGRLVDDILRFLNIGRQKMEAGPVDMVKLTAEIFAGLQAAHPARKLRLESAALPAAWGDRDMLGEALRNILSNAVKFSPVDDEVLIEVGGSTAKNENVYSVRDHGIGFDMRYVDKLFRVFERVHPTGQYEGTGMGLAIVKRIVTRHGGRVWAQGKVGEGASIYFALPNREQEHG